MENKYPNLFSPLKVRRYVFKNRVMFSPLGAWTFSPDNYIFDYAISTFEERAKGGAGSVCIGHTEVHYKDEDTDGFGLYFDLRKREGTGALSTYAETIQQYGSHASIELNYGGMHSERGHGDSVSFDLNGGGTPDGKVRPMTQEKMQEIIGNYTACVRKMNTCGFHMVTIHGAHGWMPAQFLSGKTNHRTDEYGGSLENRMRFPLELMQAVRKAAGNMIVEYRISGVDPEKNPEEFEEYVEYLNRLEGLADIVHLSSGDMSDGGMHTFPTYLAPRGTNRQLARALHGQINIPIAVVGAISQPEMAEEIVANGEAEFVAMCRTLIADPQWPNKARCGRDDDIRPCMACYNCLDKMHTTHFLGCDVNPRCGMEHRVPEYEKAADPKKVVIVGGGPSGMMAAITAADRGHTVTLLEKTSALGGLLKISDDNETKWMLNNYKNYLTCQVGKRAITVKLNTEATPELVESLRPDAVVVASGSNPIVPKVPGVDGKNVYTCIQAHEREYELGDRIVLVGGNLVGCEEALHLGAIGKREISVVEMTDTIHADAGMAAGAIDVKLNEYGIHIYKNATCTGISEEGVMVEQSGKTILIPCDTVILAVGMRSNYGVYEDLLSTAPVVEPVGDCIMAATVHNATRTAFYVARNL